MNETIRGYATAVAGMAAHAGTSRSLSSELGELVAFLEGADELQWALTDTSIPVTGRRAIVEELLTGKIGDLAVRLVSFTVGNDKPTDTVANLRWVTGFVEAVENAGIDGDDVSLGLPDELIGPPVGRQGTHERVGGYAAAVFAVVHGEGRLAEIEDELFRFARVVEGNGELRRALANWNTPSRQRARLVTDLLGGKVDRVTVSLVSYALRAGNVGSLVALLDWLVERAAIERNGRVGEVRTAVELTGEQLGRMEAALRRAVGHDVELRSHLDPSVIGGAQIVVGDLEIDGTVKRKLEAARTSLLGTARHTR